MLRVPESLESLLTSVGFLSGTVENRGKNGKRHERWDFLWLTQTPLSSTYKQSMNKTQLCPSGPSTARIQTWAALEIRGVFRCVTCWWCNMVLCGFTWPAFPNFINSNDPEPVCAERAQSELCLGVTSRNSFPLLPNGLPLSSVKFLLCLHNELCKEEQQCLTK